MQCIVERAFGSPGAHREKVPIGLSWFVSVHIQRWLRTT
jgi:hypothetical protein